MVPYRCLTNNPLVLEKGLKAAEYHDENVLDLFLRIEQEVLDGYKLLTHPLSSSIRPDIGPYKSVLLSRKKGTCDPESLDMIAKAIQYTRDLYAIREDPLYLRWGDEAKEDFALVDWSIIERALEVEHCAIQ